MDNMLVGKMIEEGLRVLYVSRREVRGLLFVFVIVINICLFIFY